MKASGDTFYKQYDFNLLIGLADKRSKKKHSKPSKLF